MLALLIASLLSVAPAPDTVVVAPAEWRVALQPWVAHRQAQGHQLEFISEWGSAEDLRTQIRAVAAGGRLQHVVLVGDVSAHGNGNDHAGVPVHLAEARVNVRWGSEPLIATDNWYADLDDDQLPDLAIGRLTADSAEEVATLVGKILAYEAASPTGTWQRRLNFVAGVGGFGALADNVIEGTTRKFLTDGIPAAYDISMTYGSWRSPYCPDPRRFRETALDRFNEGCLFWVYIGHGQRTYLDRVLVPGAAFPIMDTDDVVRLRCEATSPIAVFLACYTGAFDAPQDCLAEEMLRAETGPVAVLAGSRVTMPYAMAVMGNELLDEFFQQRPETLGQLVQQSKRRLARELDAEQASPQRQLLDALAAVISPSRDQLSEERREHVLLFNLLGDPLLRLPHAEPITVDAVDEIEAGQKLRIRGIAQRGGRGTVELVCRRDRWKSPPPRRDRFEPTDAALAAYSQTYDAANDRRWVVQSFETPPGEFETEIEVPLEANGPCYVRVFLDDGQQHALGASYVFVRRPVRPTAESEPVAGTSQN